MTNTYWVGQVLMKSALKVWGGLEVVHPEKRIEEGGAIIAANHASFLDPPAVGCSYDREITFLARSTLFEGTFRWLLPRLNAVPIERDSADLKSMKTILRKLKEGNRILMFPEGTRTSDGKLQPVKPGIGMLVAKSGVPVQPVRIEGTFEALPRSGKFKPHKIRVIIGDPVHFAEEDLQRSSRDSYQRLADRLVEAIGELVR